MPALASSALVINSSACNTEEDSSAHGQVATSGNSLSSALREPKPWSVLYLRGFAL